MGVSHLSTDWITVDMNIQRTHEDRNLKPAICKILISLDLFDGYNFSVGGGYDGIFPMVEGVLQGRGVGDTCQVRLAPDDAFGEYEADMVRIEPRKLFPENVTVGMQFEGAVEGSDHYKLYTITEIADDKVVVDGNHPLAGQTLVFSCTVIEVRAATEEELHHGHVHGPGGHHH